METPPADGHLAEVRTIGPAAEIEFAGIEDAYDEWDALAGRLGASPFSRPGWIKAWWSAFGSGRPMIALARRDGELTGVLPLMRKGNGPLRACANAHTPLFDALAVEDAARDALLTAALKESRRGIVLSRVDTDGALAQAAERLSGHDDCHLRTLGAATVSTIGPGLTWEEFEAGMSSERRRGNRRRLRKLEKEVGAVEWRTVTADLDDASFEDFLRLEANPWKVARGTAIRQSDALSGFYREALEWAARESILRLRFLLAGGAPVAVQLTMDDPGRRWAMKIGFDTELSRYSPGVLNLLDEAKFALEDDLTLELGGGEESLKVELRTGTWDLGSVALFPRSLSGLTAAAATSSRGRAYDRARRSKNLQTARNQIRRLRAAVL